MTWIRWLSLALFGVYLFGAPAHADWMTGNDLHRSCTSRDADAAGMCIGYIVGAASVLFDATAGGFARVACTKKVDSITAGQIRDIVKMYLIAHPERRHESAWVLVSEALKQAFPCDR